MRRISNFCLLISVLLLISTNLSAQSNNIVRSKIDPKMPALATLYALDPLAHTFCLSDGQAGHIVNQNQLYNRCSDLDFNWYFANNFTVGNEGSRLGNIVDLGTADELAKKYQSREFGIATNQIFVALRLDNESIVIVNDKKTVQPVRESVDLLTDGKSSATIPVKLGHIYLIRITDKSDKSFQLFAKMLVVAHTPNEAVSIRWQVL